MPTVTVDGSTAVDDGVHRDAHTGGSVVVDTGLTAGELTLPAGSGALAKNAVPVRPVEIASQLIANPTGYYFDIHTGTSPDAAVRGQLFRTQ